jgi:prepilin-type N-terminal cleavage/methylation domain-containing protein
MVTPVVRCLQDTQSTSGGYEMLGGARKRTVGQGGYSLVELITVMALFGVIAASGIPHFDMRRQDINNVMSSVIADIRFARARSITTGTHYAFQLTEDGGYLVERLKEDDGEWVSNGVAKTVALPDHITLSIDRDLDRVEFNTRGMMISSDEFFSMTVADTANDASHEVTIWPSGQVYYEY